MSGPDRLRPPIEKLGDLQGCQTKYRTYKIVREPVLRVWSRSTQKDTQTHLCIQLMNKDPFIKFKMSDGITHCMGINLVTWLWAHTWIFARDSWYINLESHLFCEHMNLIPNIAPSIKRPQLIVYRCVWGSFCIALIYSQPQPGELRLMENWYRHRLCPPPPPHSIGVWTNELDIPWETNKWGSFAL